jgi:hypothetical protein
LGAIWLKLFTIMREVMTARRLTASERDWLTIRSYLTEHRYELAVEAAGDYPPGGRVAGTPLLAARGWLPPVPIPLQDIGLELTDADPETQAEAELEVPPSLLPQRADGTRYRRYSEAMGELAAPLVFENRATYRLTEADLTSAAPRLAFAGGRYFDGIDTGEAAAHEYAAAHRGGQAPGPRPAGLRERFADPCDLRRRPANLAISTLTYATDLLTVAVIDSDVFDAWFGVNPRRNAEGHILAAREFAGRVIDRTVTGEPVQAAGAALLRLAWRHRETLGG